MCPEPVEGAFDKAQATAARLVRRQHPQPAHTRLNGRSSSAHRRLTSTSRSLRPRHVSYLHLASAQNRGVSVDDAKRHEGWPMGLRERKKLGGSASLVLADTGAC